MKYCSECGGKLALHEGALGAMSRFICTACGSVFHQSPRLGAGCLAEWDGKILLCRRAVQPEWGMWGLPAGFVAIGESTQAAATRETLEEAGVAVELRKPYALLHIQATGQLRIIYLARLLDDRFEPGPETLEAKLFAEAEMPWDQLAFATTRFALRRYFSDRVLGAFPLFFADIVPVNGKTAASPTAPRT
ncbi:MAG TPA: NUDIX hydrolase [Casimicrobiaceae bacterium]|nr:NUDIX hydrolase [Casimicrobiaceae bacterium]